MTPSIKYICHGKMNSSESKIAPKIKTSAKKKYFAI